MITRRGKGIPRFFFFFTILLMQNSDDIDFLPLDPPSLSSLLPPILSSSFPPRFSFLSPFNSNIFLYSQEDLSIVSLITHDTDKLLHSYVLILWRNNSSTNKLIYSSSFFFYPYNNNNNNCGFSRRIIYVCMYIYITIAHVSYFIRLCITGKILPRQSSITWRRRNRDANC